MILTFVLLQFLNIVISTFKSVLLIKGTKAHAALINAVSYSLGIFITYYVSNEISIYYSIPITFILNLFGVYIGLTILDKIRKDQLWRISTTIKADYLVDYISELRSEGVQLMPYETGRTDYSVVDIFSNNREETKKIHPIMKKYQVKYTILKSN
ncbi:MAG: hypothetical protein WC006_08600 [Bacilli bacterium]